MQALEKWSSAVSRKPDESLFSGYQCHTFDQVDLRGLRFIST